MPTKAATDRAFVFTPSPVLKTRLSRPRHQPQTPYDGGERPWVKRHAWDLTPGWTAFPRGEPPNSGGSCVMETPA